MKRICLLLVVLLLSLVGCSKGAEHLPQSSTIKEVQKLIEEGNNQKAYEVLS